MATGIGALSALIKGGSKGRTQAVTFDRRGNPRVVEIGPQGGKIIGYRKGRPIYLDTWKKERRSSLFAAPKKRKKQPVEELPLFAFGQKSSAAAAEAERKKKEAAAALAAADEVKAAAALKAAEKAAKTAKEEAAKANQKIARAQYETTGPRAKQDPKTRGTKMEHQEVGEHVWGSRADRAVTRAADLDDMDLGEAAARVTKKKLLPHWDRAAFIAAGGEPGGWHLIQYVMKAVAGKPTAYRRIANFTEGEQRERLKNYIDGIDLLVKTLERTRTRTDVEEALEELGEMKRGWQREHVYYDSEFDAGAAAGLSFAQDVNPTSYENDGPILNEAGDKYLIAKRFKPADTYAYHGQRADDARWLRRVEPASDRSGVIEEDTELRIRFQTARHRHGQEVRRIFDDPDVFGTEKGTKVMEVWVPVGEIEDPQGGTVGGNNARGWGRSGWSMVYPQHTRLRHAEDRGTAIRATSRGYVVDTHLGGSEISIDRSGATTHLKKSGASLTAQIGALGRRIEILTDWEARTGGHWEDKPNKAWAEAKNAAIELDKQSWEEIGTAEAQKAKKEREKRFKWSQHATGKPERTGGPPGVEKADGLAFAGEFKLRNVQYGRSGWMTDADRAHHLKECHNALRDLSDVLKIAPEDLSLNGRLSVGFGARGSGSFAAHYEPEGKIINLTKFAGGGTLAHEWGHFLDNVIAESAEGGQSTRRRYLSHMGGESQHYRGPELKGDPKLQAAVDGVMLAMMAANPDAAVEHRKALAVEAPLKEAAAKAAKAVDDYDPGDDPERKVHANAWRAVKAEIKETKRHAPRKPKGFLGSPDGWGDLSPKNYAKRRLSGDLKSLEERYDAHHWGQQTPKKWEQWQAYEEHIMHLHELEKEADYESGEYWGGLDELRNTLGDANKALREASKEVARTGELGGVASDYRRAALRMGGYSDGNRGRQLDAYYAREHEMFARAFEAFIQDELEDNGRRNSYLVDGTRRTYHTGKIIEGRVPDELLEKVPEVKAAADELRKMRGSKERLGRRSRYTAAEIKEAEKEYQLLVLKHSEGHESHAQPYPQGLERHRINDAMRALVGVISKGGRLKKALDRLQWMTR